MLNARSQALDEELTCAPIIMKLGVRSLGCIISFTVLEATEVVFLETGCSATFWLMVGNGSVEEEGVEDVMVVSLTATWREIPLYNTITFQRHSSVSRQNSRYLGCIRGFMLGFGCIFRVCHENGLHEEDRMAAIVVRTQ